MKFGVVVRAWDALTQAKFCKHRIRGYTPFWQFFKSKITNFGDFGSHF